MSEAIAIVSLNVRGEARTPKVSCEAQRGERIGRTWHAVVPPPSARLSLSPPASTKRRHRQTSCPSGPLELLLQRIELLVSQYALVL